MTYKSKKFYCKFFNNSDPEKTDIEVVSSRPDESEAVRPFDTFKNDICMADTSEDDKHLVTYDEYQHVHDYILVRDRTRRMIRSLRRYGYLELIASLVAASKVLENKPSSVLCALASKEKTQWLNTMNGR